MPVHDPEGSSRPLLAVPGPPGLGVPLSTPRARRPRREVHRRYLREAGHHPLARHSPQPGLPTARRNGGGRSALASAE